MNIKDYLIFKTGRKYVLVFCESNSKLDFTYIFYNFKNN